MRFRVTLWPTGAQWHTGVPRWKLWCAAKNFRVYKKIISQKNSKKLYLAGENQGLDKIGIVVQFVPLSD